MNDCLLSGLGFFFLLTQWCHIYAVCYFILDVYSYFFTIHVCLNVIMFFIIMSVCFLLLCLYDLVSMPRYLSHVC